MSEPPAIETRLRPDWEVDPMATLAPLWQGPGDPQMRIGRRVIERATRTPAGTASLRLEIAHGEVTVTAWGSGAEWVVTSLPDLLGKRDEPALLVPRHPLIARLFQRHRGLRLTRTGLVMEALLPAIIGQKVTSAEARRSYRELIARLGEPAPGPLGLRIAPDPGDLARQPYWTFHHAGLERRRADTLRRAGAVAGRLEDITARDVDDARRRLASVAGIGPWTVAEALRPALGDPDALSVGDFHVPNLVSWALAGEARANDTRMLELLEPYRGQRARVVMLLELGGNWPPRFGPRMPARSFRRI